MLINNRVIATAAGEVIYDPSLQRADLTEMVTQTFIEQLGRPGEQAGIEYWVGQAENMRSNGVSDAGIQAELDARFRNTDEFRSKEMIQSVYQEVLDRTGETAGVNAWHAVATDLSSQGLTDDEVRANLVEQFKLSDENLGNLIVDVFREATGTDPSPAFLTGLATEARALRDAGLNSRQIEAVLHEQYSLTHNGLHRIVRETVQEVFDRPAGLDEWVEYTGRAVEYRDEGLSSVEIRERLTEEFRLSDEALSKVMVRTYAEATGSSARPEALRGMWEEVVALRNDGLGSRQIESQLAENYALSGSGIQHTVRQVYEEVFGQEFGELDAWAHWQDRATSLRDEGGLDSASLALALDEEMRISDDGLNHMISAMYGEELGQAAEFENVQEWLTWAKQLRNQGFQSADIEGFLTAEYRRWGVPEGDTALAAGTVIGSDGAVHSGPGLPEGAIVLAEGGTLRSNGNVLNHLGDTVFDPDVGFLTVGSRSAAGDMILADGSIKTRADFLAEGGWMPPEGATVLGENDYRMDGYYQLESGALLIDSGAWINAQGEITTTPDGVRAPVGFVQLETGGVLTNGILQTREGTVALSGSQVSGNADLLEMVEDTYTGLLGREGEEAGLRHWLDIAGRLRAEGHSDRQIQSHLDEQFKASEEYKTLEAGGGLVVRAAGFGGDDGGSTSSGRSSGLSLLGYTFSSSADMTIRDNGDGTFGISIISDTAAGRGTRGKDTDIDGGQNVNVSLNVQHTVAFEFESEEQAEQFLGLYQDELIREENESLNWNQETENAIDQAGYDESTWWGWMQATAVRIGSHMGHNAHLADVGNRAMLPSLDALHNQGNAISIARDEGVDYSTTLGGGLTASFRFTKDAKVVFPGGRGGEVGFDTGGSLNLGFAGSDNADGTTATHYSLGVDFEGDVSGSLQSDLPPWLAKLAVPKVAGSVSGERSVSFIYDQGQIVGIQAEHTVHHTAGGKFWTGHNGDAMIAREVDGQTSWLHKTTTFTMELPPGVTSEAEAWQVMMDDWENQRWEQNEKTYQTTSQSTSHRAGYRGSTTVRGEYATTESTTVVVDEQTTSWLNPTGWEENAPGQGSCGETGGTGGSSRPSGGDGPCGGNSDPSNPVGEGPCGANPGSGNETTAPTDGPCGTNPYPADETPEPAEGPCGTDPDPVDDAPPPSEGPCGATTSFVTDSAEVTDPEPIVIPVQLASEDPEPIVFSVQLADEEESEDPPPSGGSTCS